MVLTRPNNLSRFPSTSPETKLQPRKSQTSNHWSRHPLAKKKPMHGLKKVNWIFQKNKHLHTCDSEYLMPNYDILSSSDIFPIFTTISRHIRVNCASKDQTEQSSPKNYLEQCWVTLFFIFCNRLNSLGNICKPNLSNIF